MPYQTGISFCYACRQQSCIDCSQNVTEIEFYHNEAVDNFVERLWRECEDIAWDENEDGELVLGQPWRGFPVGEFTQDDQFHWVDEHHSKGVGWVYENISPYEY